MYQLPFVFFPELLIEAIAVYLSDVPWAVPHMMESTTKLCGQLSKKVEMSMMSTNNIVMLVGVDGGIS